MTRLSQWPRSPPAQLQQCAMGTILCGGRQGEGAAAVRVPRPQSPWGSAQNEMLPTLVAQTVQTPKSPAALPALVQQPVHQHQCQATTESQASRASAPQPNQQSTSGVPASQVRKSAQQSRDSRPSSSAAPQSPQTCQQQSPTSLAGCSCRWAHRKRKSWWRESTEEQRRLLCLHHCQR